MARTIIKLPESELEVMQAIWELYENGERAISAGLIVKKYPELTRLKLTTVLTLITRLQSKGFIKTEKIGRSNCYFPLVPRDEYRDFISGDFVKKLFIDDKVGLICALVNDDKLTHDELEAIKAVIEKNENK